MEMKSMKCEPKEGSPVQAMSPNEGPMYPYGLCLYLDEDTLKKLGLTELPKLGEKIAIMAKAEVKMVSESKNVYGVERRLELQITDMALGPVKG